MKKFIFTVLCLTSLFALSTAHATVGGAHYFSDFYYQAADNTIWFIMNREDGLGCSDLFKYSIEAEKLNTEISCANEVGFQMEKQVQEKLKDLQENATKLKTVDLNQLNLKFESALLNSNFFDSDGQVKVDLGLIDPEFWWSDYLINWEITPVLNSEAISTFTIPSCIKRTPVNFSGLASPNNDFLIIISTTISQCYEYGYPKDYFNFIPNIKIPSSAQIEEYQPAFTHSSNGPEIVPQINKIFLELDSTSINSYLNDIGYQAYLEGSYQSAIYLFEEAYTSSYLLPLFNLAATQAKIGEELAALNNIELLLSQADSRDYYISKIRNDSDFESLHEDPKYEELFGDTGAPVDDFTKLKKLEKTIEKNQKKNAKEEDKSIKMDYEASSSSQSNPYFLIIIATVMFVIGLFAGKKLK